MADVAAQHLNPNVKAQMSNKGILPILYSIGPIRHLTFGFCHLIFLSKQ
jgi:glutathionylspermidine synthase